MGLFNFGPHDDDLAVAPRAKDGKLYKTLQLLSIIVIIVAIALVIFGVFDLVHLGTTGFGAVLSIGVVGLGLLTALPWVRIFEGIKEKPFKITAIVFLAITAVVVILWIVCVWQVVKLVSSGIKGADEEAIKGLVSSLRTIRVTLIVSLQFVVLSYIAMNFVKYRKTLLPYQIIAAVAYLFIDFYLSLVLTALTITNDGIGLSDTAVILTNKWLLALFIIAVLAMIFPNIVFKRADRRRLVEAAAENRKGTDNADRPEVESGAKDADKQSGGSADEKLRKIKDLRDSGLITQEEYEKKRSEILDSI